MPDGMTGFVVGVAVGLLVTFFASLLTELVVFAAICAVALYIGRKRWKTDTPSTAKTSRSSSL